MHQSQSQIGKNLANNVEALRAARHMTQSELAKKSGLPRSTLTNIESGSGNPSLSNLVKLSRALHVTIEELLAKPKVECHLTKSSKLPERTFDRGKITVNQLLPEPLPGLEIEKMTIEPGGVKTGVPHIAGTREFTTVVRGELKVYVAGENNLLLEALCIGNRSTKNQIL
jgi:transcriptional regulator with XRE-family HTH domain